MIRCLDWDTRNFGMKIGCVTSNDVMNAEQLSAILGAAKAEGYRLLYLRGVYLPETLLSEDVLLADEKVVYVREATTDTGFETDLHVVSVVHQPMGDDLLRLSLESGKYSRYKLDSHFSPSVFRTLYERWMENSLRGEIATDVLAYRLDGKCVGVLTYLIKENVAEIGLVAVSEHCAGRGIGSRLMRSFLSRLPEGTTVEVATQRRNAVACRYYEKNGFRVGSVTNIYHVWLR